MILLRSFLSGHIRIKRTLEYYDAGIGPRVPFGGGFGPTVSANFAVALNDYTTLSTLSSLPSGLSVSRSGNAMVTDSTGKLTWAANNLLTYSQAINGTNWTVVDGTSTVNANAPDSTSTASTFTSNTGSVRPYCLKSATTPDGNYIISIYAKKGSSANPCNVIQLTFAGDSGGYANFDLANGVVGSVSGGTSGMIDAGGGWWRCYFRRATFNATGFIVNQVNNNTSATRLPTYTAANATECFIWGAQLEAVTYQTTPSTYVATTTAAYYGPRLDYYWNGSAYVAKGYLVEGAGTNYCPYSSTQTGWSVTGIGTPQTNNATAPDGTTAATKLTASSGNSAHVFYIAMAAGSGTAITLSIYVKNSTARYVYLNAYQAANINASSVYDLQTSAVGEAHVGSSGGVVTGRSIVDVGSGWYRITLSASFASGTAGFFGIGMASAATGNTWNTSGDVTFTATGSEAVFVWGAQMETSSYATSLIPTTTTSVNRAAETLSLANYTNRLVEAFYIDEQTGVSSRALTQPSATSPVTISGLPWGWLTSLRAYTNGYAGDPTLPAWLSVAATGNRMYYDSTGTLTWAPNNLLTYSNTFSNAAWVTTGSTSTMSASVATDPFGGTNSWTQDNTGTSPYVYQSVGTLDDKTYTASVYLKKNTARYGYIILVIGTKRYAVLFDLQTGAFSTDKNTAPLTNRAYSITSAGNGWYRCSVTGQNTGGGAAYIVIENADTSAITVSGSLDISNATNGQSIYVYGAQFEAVTYQTAPRAYIPTTTAAVFNPRFDTDPATLAARGLLIEGAAENLYFPSNTLTTTRTSSGATVASSSITAPDGTTNSWLYTTTNATSVNYNSSYYTSAANQPNTASIFAKKGTARYVLVVLTRFADRYGVLFDLDTGNFVADFNTSTALTGKSYSSQNVGNGWYRLNVTGTGSDARTGINVGFTNTAAATVNASLDLTNADVGVTGYMFGFQIVQSATVSSYVPTSGASVTRAAETISAAQYGTNPSIIQYRPIPAGTRARKIIDPFSGISSETNEWIESGAVYPMGTASAYLNTKLTVDGPY